MRLYENPFYYDIAFSFRNIKKEVDFFEKCIDRFSKVKVKKVLEIGCGTSPYLIELNKNAKIACAIFTPVTNAITFCNL